jgi:hypothetical protein
MNMLGPMLLSTALLACAGAAAAEAPPRAAVTVVSAQAGLFGPPAAARGEFVASQQLPLADGQEFGWRLEVRTAQKSVRVVEELTLPSEPRTWGDPEPGLKRRTTPDGRTAITELDLVPAGGFVQSRWTVTTGDPKGTWILKVRVENQPERVFRIQAR